MTSNINPNDINGAYPVAGQDNNSQGFRDNFTNTSTNFQYAADEITDLQNKAVLKAALTGSTLDNNMNGSLLYNAQLQQMTNTVLPLGTGTGTITLNFANGSYQTITTNGPITLIVLIVVTKGPMFPLASLVNGPNVFIVHSRAAKQLECWAALFSTRTKQKQYRTCQHNEVL